MLRGFYHRGPFLKERNCWDTVLGVCWGEKFRKEKRARRKHATDGRTLFLQVRTKKNQFKKPLNTTAEDV